MISAIFVTYRSAEPCRQAIDGFRAGARDAGEEAEVVAVVNSGDAEEAEALRPGADRVLAPPRNLGFAGGLNAGIEVARGEILFLANPDLVFAPDSVAHLLEAVRRDAFCVAGPRFFLDDAMTLHLPPAEEPHPASLVRRRLAFDETRRRHVFERDARRALFEARSSGVRTVSALSGALVVGSRRTLSRVGPFDEGYALYYEENDWQRRLLALGGTLVRALDASVVHHWAQSTRSEPRAAEWFAASERRFFVSHFGERGERALATLQTAPGNLPRVAAPDEIAFERVGCPAIGLAAEPSLHPFALALLEAGSTTWRIPQDVRARRSGPWFVRAFDAATLLAVYFFSFALIFQ